MSNNNLTPEKPTLSLCMIVKNEGQFLEKCLTSVKNLVDEIIIVDTGSTDNTKEIAKKFTDKIFDFVWCDDFSAARNESLKHAIGDWILILDADEVIAKHDFDLIRKSILDKKYNGYILHQLNYTNEAHPRAVKVNDPDFKHAIISPITRLFRNSKEIYFDFYVHESVDPSLMKLNSKVSGLSVAIHHYGQLKKEVFNRQKEEYYFKLVLKNIEKYPWHAHSHYIAAVGFKNLKNNVLEAIKYCKKAIELQPKNVKYQSYLNAINQ